MTDEQLIEEAAKAIFEADPPNNPHGPNSDLVFDEPYTRDHSARARKHARAALAVFEKALGEATVTPTDDEREALAKAMCAIENRSKAATLEEVQAGIQRWTRHRYEADRLIEELAEYGFSLRRSEVPEPSACLNCGRDFTDGEPRARYVGRGSVHSVSCSMQGEPSDAQEQAAAREYHERGNGKGSFDLLADHVRAGLIFRMRAALRAANNIR